MLLPEIIVMHAMTYTQKSDRTNHCRILAGKKCHKFDLPNLIASNVEFIVAEKRLFDVSPKR